MGRATVILLPVSLIALVAGCGAKKPPPAVAPPPTVEIPQTWSGVTFDEEIDGLGADLGTTTTGRRSCVREADLEAAAGAGQLTEEQIACIDHALRLAPRQTQKDALSRLLLADAWSKQDWHRWEGAARRHLAEIDGSDPDLSYLLAVHLSKQGTAWAFDAIRFAEQALENRERWGPEVHTERVFTMYRVRALSAAELWYYYERELLADKSPEMTAQVDRWRSTTKSNAREWLEYAWHIDEDVTVPYELCVSAAGTLVYCEIGFDEAEATAE